MDGLRYTPPFDRFTGFYFSGCSRGFGEPADYWRLPYWKHTCSTCTRSPRPERLSPLPLFHFVNRPLGPVLANPIPLRRPIKRAVLLSAQSQSLDLFA
jgi:hypothetical protein